MANFPKFVLAFLFLLTACDQSGFLDSEDDADDVVDNDSRHRPARPGKLTWNGSSSTASGDTSDGVGGSDDDGSTSSTTDSSTSSGSGGEGGQGGSAEPQLRIHLSLEDTPRSQIILPFQTSGQAYAFATYDVMNESDEDIVITRIQIDQVNWNGDIADFGAVNVTMGQVSGMWLHSDGWRIASGEIDSSAHFTEGPLDFDTTAAVTSFTVPARQTQKVRIAAYMSQIRSGSSVDGSWYGYARSGHTPALEIVSVETDAGSVYMDEHGTSPMVLRKSMPTITQQPLATNTLADGDMDLIKFQVSADVAGPVALKIIHLALDLSEGVNFGQLFLRRGAMNIPSSEYALSTANFSQDGLVRITFLNEEVINGSGQVYTLHGNVSGIALGASIAASLANSLDVQTFGSSRTGSVASIPGKELGLHSQYPVGDYISTFIWSDISEQPHSANISQGTSVDWINDAFVTGIGFSETLSL